MTALQTVFRLLPCPEPIALCALRSPAPGAPVAVTGNYELTVRRVARALASMECWMLVCDSRGIDVWCASMAGHLGTKSIIDAVAETGLPELTHGGRMILPELCASNVSLERLQEEAGCRGEFGPRDIADLPRYLEAAERNEGQDPAIRVAAFRAPDRVQMAVGSPILLLVVLALLYNFLGMWPLALIVPCLYAYSVPPGLLFPRRPIGAIGWWAAAVAGVVLVLHGALSLLFFPGFWQKSALTASLGMGYLVTEFTGWSPLVRYSLLPRPRPRVRVEAVRCVGCGRCVSVCPRLVFDVREDRSVVCREVACVACRSCFAQCPTSAVRHSEDRRDR